MMIYDYDNDEEDERLKKVLPAATDKAREEHTVTHDADQAIHSNLNTIMMTMTSQKRFGQFKKQKVHVLPLLWLLVPQPTSYFFFKVVFFFKHTLKLVKEKVLHWKRCGRWGV